MIKGLEVVFKENWARRGEGYMSNAHNNEDNREGSEQLPKAFPVSPDVVPNLKIDPFEEHHHA